MKKKNIVMIMTLKQIFIKKNSLSAVFFMHNAQLSFTSVVLSNCHQGWGWESSDPSKTERTPISPLSKGETLSALGFNYSFIIFCISLYTPRIFTDNSYSPFGNADKSQIQRTAPHGKIKDFPRSFQSKIFSDKDFCRRSPKNRRFSGSC